VLHLGRRHVVIHQILGIEHQAVDDVNVEHLALTLVRPDLPLSALSRQVGEKRLSHLVVAELSRRVRQHWVIIKTVIGK
jgi:hypothetical protein